eukprot:gene10184-biopygen7223
MDMLEYASAREECTAPPTRVRRAPPQRRGVVAPCRQHRRRAGHVGERGADGGGTPPADAAALMRDGRIRFGGSADAADLPGALPGSTGGRGAQEGAAHGRQPSGRLSGGSRRPATDMSHPGAQRGARATREPSGFLMGKRAPARAARSPSPYAPHNEESEKEGVGKRRNQGKKERRSQEKKESGKEGVGERN